MSNGRIRNFAGIEDALRCPRCGKAMHLEETALRCEGGHCYNVSSKGSVNFVPDAKPVDHYDLESFECRRRVMEAGLYYPVVDMLLGELEMALITSVGTGTGGQPQGSGQRWLVLDAGCGEGYFTRTMREHVGCAIDTNETWADCSFVGLDFSKDAIHVAARGGGDICWIVGDIAHLPFADHSVNCLINAFAPANYAEFRRVLTADGTLIKVVPGPRHLQELRERVGGSLAHEDYSNQRVIDHFAENFDLVRRIGACRQGPIEKDRLADLLRMTPLLFGVDISEVDTEGLGFTSTDATLLVGTVPAESDAAASDRASGARGEARE